MFKRQLFMKACLLGTNLLLLCAAGSPQVGGGAQAQDGPYSATPQRPTFTSNTSTTAPGTLEVEFGAAGTTSSGGFLALPTAVKFTPDVRSGLFRLAEFSLSFDAVSSAPLGAGGATQFGDRLGFVIRRPVYRGKVFSLALAPRATFFLRNDQGARLGGTVLAEYTSGLNDAVVNVTWTAATSSSPTNPPQQYDFAFDFTRALGGSGLGSRWAVFGGVLCEKPSNAPTIVSLEQGMSYQARPNWVLDFAVRQQGLAAGPRGYQILAGLTVNLGRLRPL